jgi:hypothetical protein
MISVGSGVKARASQRCRNNCFSDSLEKGAPPKLFGGPQGPHPGVSRGGDERSPSLKLDYKALLYYTRMTVSKLLDPPAMAIVSGPR